MSLGTELKADYAVNRRLLDRITVTVFRLNQAAQRGRIRIVKRFLAKAVDVLWMQVVVGADMPGKVKCGPGLRLPHGGRGIAIHPNVRIGSNVTLYHRVTLGGSGPDKHNVPSVEDDAYFGVGASVIGRVRIGAGARVGAGAVVTKDVPDHATAVGNPALPLKPSRIDRKEPLS